MNKRVWSIAVALVMLLSMICSVFIVSAADDVLQIALSSESVSAGDALDATVQLNNYASDWNDLAIRLEYDPSMLEIVSVDTSGFAADGSYTEETAGILEAKWSYEEAVVKEETAFDAMKISFKVKDAAGASSLKAALQAGEITAEAQAEFEIAQKIELSLEAPLLSAGEAPSLALTTAQTELAVSNEFAVSILLENYAGGWATFTAEVPFDPSVVEYLGYEAADIATEGDPAGALQPIVEVVDDDGNKKLVICWLSDNAQNLPAADSIKLMDLKFKALAAADALNFSASFKSESVAGYVDGVSTLITPENNGYSETPATLATPITIEKKVPYLTVKLDGDVTSVKNGRQVNAIVTLNDFYEGWAAMTLLLEYDTSVFEIEDPETDIVNLGAFPGMMTCVEQGNGMAISLANTDANYLLTDESGNPTTSADILKITLTAKAETEGAVIGTSFVEGGNIKYDPTNPEESEVILSGGTEENPGDFITAMGEEKGGSVDITVEEALPPYLSLEIEGIEAVDGVTTVHQGDQFNLNVWIHDFYEVWSAMSLFVQFETDLYEVDETQVQGGVFGAGNASVIPFLSEEKDTLGVTLLSNTGEDLGLENGANEGIILTIPMVASTEIKLTSTDFPISVSFAPEGNMSEGEVVDASYYKNGPEDPVVLKMSVQAKPSISIKLADDQTIEDFDSANPSVKQGEEVQFVVSVSDFTGAWDVMTLMLKYDTEAFTFVSATDLEPFKEGTVAGAATFMTEVDESQSYPLLACWFNGESLAMKNTDQDVMTFILKAKEGVDLTEEQLKQAVSVAFVPDGNYSGGEVLDGETDYIDTPAKVEIAVEEVEQTVSVLIEWGAMEFTYSFGTWNTTEHVWDGRGWTCAAAGDDMITVTNQGGVDIKATFSFAAADGMTGLDGAFKQDGAVVTQPLVIGKVVDDTQLSAAVQFELGALPEGATLNPEGATALGTITVTIDKAESE